MAAREASPKEFFLCAAQQVHRSCASALALLSRSWAGAAVTTIIVGMHDRSTDRLERSIHITKPSAPQTTYFALTSRSPALNPKHKHLTIAL